MGILCFVVRWCRLGAGQAQDLPVQSLWFVGSAILEVL